MAQLNVRELGGYIREQRHGAQISLRQLARLAGVSNPYLSQIERGLRRPSAEILQQIAKALRISAEALYVQAGILEEREGDTDVPGAVIRDPALNERQKQVLLEIYNSFRRENDAKAQSAAADEIVAATPATPTPATPANRPAPRASTGAREAAQRTATNRTRSEQPEATGATKSAARRTTGKSSRPTTDQSTTPDLPPTDGSPGQAG